MDSTLHKILLAADKPQNYTSEDLYEGDPEEVANARRRGQAAVSEINSKLRSNLELDEWIQDAFFWGISYEPSEESVKRCPRTRLKFSRCGSLVATWAGSNEVPLPAEQLEQIKEILKSHGFQWVDGNMLKQERYDGAYEYFKSWHHNAPATWWDRFFEYD